MISAILSYLFILKLKQLKSIVNLLIKAESKVHNRGESRAAATSKMECFVIITYSLKPLNIIIKHSILDVAAALDPPLHKEDGKKFFHRSYLIYISPSN